MTFIFAILGPNHRVKLGDGAAQLKNSAHAHIPVAVLDLVWFPAPSFVRMRVRGKEGSGKCLCLSADPRLECERRC